MGKAARRAGVGQDRRDPESSSELAESRLCLRQQGGHAEMELRVTSAAKEREMWEWMVHPCYVRYKHERSC